MNDLGRIIIVLGIILIVVGIIVTFSSKIPFLGRLPGDIYIHKKGFTLYFPLATSILLSVIVSAILYFFRK
jgi:DUF2905 family protein